MAHQGPFWATYQDLKAGKITRREFIARATALGVALPVTMFVLNSIKIDGASAQDAASATRASVNTENQTRGAGGELKILQWQAATIAFAHKGQGTKDSLASSLIVEPLFSYAPEGFLLPTLAEEVPTIENGGLSEDLLTATINLKEGVLWNDGEPFTAEDVLWTWQWIRDEANNSTSYTTWETVESIEVLSDSQVAITFNEASLAWYVPLAGAYFGGIIPKHVWDGQDADSVNTAFLTNPVGTGPYKVETFRENDQVIYVINEHYREPNKPYFSTVNLKGGGDASSAAQAVLQTGDWHFAWNLQVEPDILRQLEEGGRGRVYATPATNVERIMFNFADPTTEVDGERAHLSVPNPRTSELAVRQAMALGVDSETIANELYMGGDLEPAGRNILTGLAAYESPNTTAEYDLERAAQILDEAGWTIEGGVRQKDGVELKVTYYTSINSVRQKNQQIVKQAWEQLGIRVQLGQVDSGVFFASAPGNDQTYGHNYRDIQMYTSGPVSPFPLTHMQDYYAGPNNSNIAQKSNDWSGVNNQRWVNAEYDAMYQEVQATTDAERAAELFIMMNDMVINEVVVIPEVSRAADKYGVSNDLVPDNIAGSGWEPLYWNIANWTAIENQ
jgi:peptide/nickel transport system substrate-binding protein